MLTIKDLEVSIDESSIVSPKSFSLKPGQCLHIRGDNGVGKTSFLKSLLGINDKVQGEIFLDGTRFLAADAGFVGHHLALFESLTVIENLTYWSNMGKTKSSVKDVLKAVHLWPLAEIFVTELSQGQKKRLALARFYLLDRRVWCLDEPFSALDANFKQQFANRLSDYLNQKGYLVITSHQSLPLSTDDVVEVWFR